MVKSQQTSTRITNHEIRLILKTKAHFRKIEDEVICSLDPPHRANPQVVDAETPMFYRQMYRELPYQVSTSRCRNIQTETRKINKIRYNMQRQTSGNLDLCLQEMEVQ